MRFKHDCDKCKFLGHYIDYDVYFCSETVVCRFGDEGHQYTSELLDVFLKDLLEDPTGFLKRGGKGRIAAIVAMAEMKVKEIINENL